MKKAVAWGVLVVLAALIVSGVVLVLGPYVALAFFACAVLFVGGAFIASWAVNTVMGD